MPLCASAAARPTALSSTVLPPVLGPLMRRVRSPAGSSRSNGTTGSAPASSSGWRPFTIDERGRRRGHLGHLAVRPHGVARAGDEVVHGDAHLDQLPQRRQLGPEQVGELAQHAERLALLLDLGLAQRVAQLDGLGRLDEERAGAAALVVNDAARAAAGSRGAPG